MVLSAAIACQQSLFQVLTGGQVMLRQAAQVVAPWVWI